MCNTHCVCFKRLTGKRETFVHIFMFFIHFIDVHIHKMPYVIFIICFNLFVNHVLKIRAKDIRNQIQINFTLSR